MFKHRKHAEMTEKLTFHYRHFYMGVREAFCLKFVLFQTFLQHVKIITECFALLGIKTIN